ncbi:hypothetical protein FQN50_001714 [Emmonsiellopsis sp. PD_5]|nr:hypothetical protein FQN50_001714 [Emmonsiellopsis sp. PD_5]
MSPKADNIHEYAVTWAVTDRHLATAVSAPTRDISPALFSTSSLVDIMEAASANALQPILSHCDTSVVARMSITHSAPTPAGTTVTAVARYRGQEKGAYKFDIVASDDGGEIAQATFWRSVVCKENIENLACLRQPTSKASIDRNSRFVPHGVAYNNRCKTCYLPQSKRYITPRGGDGYSHGFFHAVDHGSGPLLRKWLTSGIKNLSAYSSEAIETAIRTGRVEVLKLLLSQGYGGLKWTGGEATPLHIAAEGKSEAVMKVLLESGMDPNVTTDEYYFTPLHYAMTSTEDGGVNCKLAKLLIDAGGDPNLRDDMGWTSLHLAVERCDVEIIKLLLDNGAALTPKTEKGDTPLRLAVRLGRKEAVTLLLERGADPFLGDGMCTATEWLNGHPVPDLPRFDTRSLRP